MMRHIHVFVLLLLAATAFAGGTPIAPPSFGPASDPIGPRSSAFAAGRFLTVWRNSSVTGGELYGALQDAEGRRLWPHATLIMGGFDSYAFDLVGAGDEFVLFHGLAEDMRMTTIDREGRAVATHPIVTGTYAHVHSAAANGDRFAVATIVNGSRLRILVVDRQANILQSVDLGSASFSRLDLLPRGDGFVAVVGGTRGPFATRIPAEGNAASTPFESWSGVNTSGVSVAGGVAVFWTRQGLGGHPTRVFKSVMRDDGFASATSSFDLPLDGWIVRLQPVMTANGIDLFVLWQRQSSSAQELAVVELDTDLLPRGAPVALLPGGEVVAAAGDTVLVSPMDAQVKTAIIRGTRVEPPQILSITPARQVEPVLGSIGNRLIAAWTEASADVRATKAAILDAGGARVSPVMDLRGQTLALASSRFDAVIVTRDGDSIVATHFGPEGTALRQIVIGSTSAPAVAGAAVWAGTHYVVAWFEGTAMKSVLLMPDGTASDVRTFALPPPHPLLADAVFYNTFSLAFDGDDLLLAYLQEVARPFQPGLRGPAIAVGVRVDRYATTVDSESTLLERDSPHGIVLGSSGNEIVAVTWNANRVVQALAIPRGRPLRVARREILFEAVLAPRAAVAWTGQDYAVAISHMAMTVHVALKFIDASLEETRPARTATSQTAGLPALASTFTGEPVLAVSETAPTGPAIAATYAAHTLAELPAPPPAPGSYSVRRQHVQLVVSWTAPARGSWDGFIIESSRATFDVTTATVLDVIAADVRQKWIYAPPLDVTVSVRAFNEGGLSPRAPRGQSRARTVRR